MSTETTAHKSQLQRLMERATALPAVQKMADAAPLAEEDDPHNPADYEWGPGRAFVTAKGARRQPGFMILNADDGGFEWVFYHSILKLRGLRMNGYDYIQFSSDGRAITIQGKGLQTLAVLIGEGRIKCLFSPAAGSIIGAADGLFVSAILITDTAIPKADDEENKAKPKLVVDTTKKTG